METILKITCSLLFSLVLALSSNAQCGTCAYPTDQLIENPNFSDGDSGFYSDYDGNPNPPPGSPILWVPGTYQIGNNANDFHYNFDGFAYAPIPFFSDFMVVNGWDIAGMNIWCQDVPVVPGGIYDFSMYVQSINTENPAILQVVINGEDAGPTFNAPPNLYNWQQHTFEWVAPPGVFTAQICIQNTNLVDGGSDFGLDAITFSGCVPYLIENAADAGPDQTVCSGETVQLGTAAAAEISYAWQNSPYLSATDVSNPTATIDNPGPDPLDVEFIVESDSAGLGCLSTDTVVITVLPLPDPTLPADISTCSFPVTLDPGVPNANYTWSTNENTATISVNGEGDYSVEVEAGGCSATAETTVALTPFEAADLGPDIVVCTLPVTLDSGVENADYVWSTNATTPTIEANTPGTYTVTVTDNGCESTDEITVTVDSELVFDLGEDFGVCAFPTTVDAPNFNNASYNWSNGDNGTSADVDGPGWVTLEIEQDGCSGSDSLFVDQIAYETVDLGPDQTVCALPITLTSNIVAESYDWSNEENTPSIEVDEPGLYTLLAVQNGCESSDEVLIEVDSDLPLDLGPDLTVCDFPVVIESPATGVNHEWSDGSTGTSITVNEPGDVGLTIEQDGCSGTDNISVFLFEPDDANLPDTLESCFPPVDLETDLVNADYVWSTGDANGPTSVEISGWVYLDYTQQGCSATDSTYVLVDQELAFEMDETLGVCAFPVSYDPGVFAEFYTWSNGSNQSSTVFESAGEYTLTISSLGCTGSQTITVAEIPHAAAALPESIETCDWPVQLTSNASSGATHLWSSGETSAEILVDAAGIYTLELTDNGCTTTDQTEVVLLPYPEVSFASEAYNLCQGESIRIEPTVEYAETLSWDNGTSGAVIQVSDGGDYTIEAANTCGSTVRTVTVIAEDCGHKLFIPNAFSPNEDGINDLFSVVMDNFESAELWIYDRYGQQVFYSPEPEIQKWNGASTGSDYYAPPAVFLYRFRGVTLQKQVIEKSGTITVVR